MKKAREKGSKGIFIPRIPQHWTLPGPLLHRAPKKVRRWLVRVRTDKNITPKWIESQAENTAEYFEKHNPCRRLSTGILYRRAKIKSHDNGKLFLFPKAIRLKVEFGTNTYYPVKEANFQP